MPKQTAILGRLLPRPYVRAIGQRALRAGIDINEETISGILILVSVLAFVIALIASLGTLGVPLFGIPKEIVAVGIAILALVVVLGALYEFAELRIDTRRTMMEEVLPDYLQLSAANIRAGMSLDKALWYAAKPEYGLLAKEMELASKRVFSGETIEQSLTKLSERFQSRYLTRTVDLIKEGIISGGEMAGILEKTAIDLRDMQLTRKEVSASMIMYSIFVGFAAVVGAPFLFVVSNKLVSLFGQLCKQQPTEMVATPYLQIAPACPGITPDDFAIFTTVLVIVTVVIATIIISIIQTGKKSNAIKYILPALAASLFIFYVGRAIIDLLFGGIAL